MTRETKTAHCPQCEKEATFTQYLSRRLYYHHVCDDCFKQRKRESDMRSYLRKQGKRVKGVERTYQEPDMPSYAMDVYRYVAAHQPCRMCDITKGLKTKGINCNHVERAMMWLENNDVVLFYRHIQTNKFGIYEERRIA